jgi:Domain of unknown function (DUF1979)
MSSRLKFDILFGEGNIRHGPNGVVLSNFKVAQKLIDRPTERSFSSILNWLERGFRVDPETQFVTVQAVVTWKHEGVLWELMPISTTEDWKTYIDAALAGGWHRAILVQVNEKDEVTPCPHGTTSVVQLSEGEVDADTTGEEYGIAEAHDGATENEGVVEEAQGVADEGDRIPRIVEQMQNEDVEALQMQDSVDSSDDDEFPIPGEWRDRGFGEGVVHDGGGNEWEYWENEIVQGA